MTEKRLTAQLKRAVIKRAGGICEYCQSQARFSPQPFSVEHILPRALGGQTALENLALSCQGCNNIKYTKVEGLDPLTNATVALFHPRQHNWDEHFNWSENFTRIIGVTPIGRATVVTLQLNREELLNFRRILFAAGEHPPIR